MRIKHWVISVITALVFAGGAQATPMSGTIYLDPLGIAYASSASNSDGICLFACDAATGDRYFNLVLANGGHLAGSFSIVASGFPTGPLSGNVRLTDASGSVVLATGGTGASALNLALGAGSYRIYVDYSNILAQFDNTAARWTVHLRASPPQLVPEPGTLALVGAALLLLAYGLRRKR